MLQVARQVLKRNASSHVQSLFPRKGEKVVVAMSGGVDSSVTAKLLADQDYDLSAVFMRNWDTRDESGSDTGCEWERDWEDVQRVCKTLSLPCKMIDLSREYWTRVFEPSLEVWQSGATPNPDVWCNREVKFGALLDHLALDTQWLATGHYARKEWLHTDEGVSVRPQLLRATDRNKDQSYYLSSIPESSLRKSFFPLGGITKPEVRSLAKAFKLPTAEREESMGICFVGEKKKFNDFVSQYLTPKPGKIIDFTTDKVVGTHQGLWNYTIGQGAKISGLPGKMFVAQKDPEENAIYVVPGSDHPALYRTIISLTDMKWIWEDFHLPAIEDGVRARIQYRHCMHDVEGLLFNVADSGDEDKIMVKFVEPQKAIAPGQIAAIYYEEWCMGCGVVDETV